MVLESAVSSLAQYLVPNAAHRTDALLEFEGVQLPLSVLRAEQPGPVIWIEAAVHGDENDGTAACLRLLRAFDGKLLRGAVVICPAANPDAYRAGALGSPKDGKNLNRMGIVTEDTFSVRWFQFLRGLVASCASVFVDLHGGGRWLDVVPFAMAPKGDAHALALAEKLDLDYVLENPSGANLIGALSHTGITSVLLESGCGSSLREEAIDRHCHNVRRILEIYEMLEPSSANKRKVPPQILASSIDLYFPEDGALERFVPVGTLLKQGDVFAQYATWPSLKNQSLVCPVDEGVLLSVHSSSLIKKGAYAALIGKP